MKALESKDLDAIIVAGIHRARQLSLPAYNTMQLQYDTGIRLSEVDTSLWMVLPNGRYFLNTKKYNHPREFLPQQIPAAWDLAIKTGDTDLYITNHRTYGRRLKLAFGGYYFKLGEKQVISHIFRHNWAKKMRIVLGSNEAVRQALGEKRLSSAVGYIASDIFYLKR